jgi:hypothetical protein
MFKYITTLGSPDASLGAVGILKHDSWDVFTKLGTVPRAEFEEQGSAMPDGIYAYTRKTGWTRMEDCTSMPEGPGVFAEVYGAYTRKLKGEFTEGDMLSLPSLDWMLEQGGCTVITEVLCARGRIRREGHGVTVCHSEPCDIVLGAHGKRIRSSFGIFTWGAPYIAGEI